MVFLNPSSYMSVLFLIAGLLMYHLHIAESIGVCYGRNGNNLPSQQEVVNLYKANGITSMRIYDPDQTTLQALKGSNIELILDVPKDNLQSLTDARAATTWIQNNVIAFARDVKFKYIAVGNEIHPADANAKFILPVMQNIQNALNSANLQNQIKVSTSIASWLVANSSPPSQASFTDGGFMNPIVTFLTQHGSPLLANIYPYFSKVDNPNDITLPYALFTSPGVVVSDNQYMYQNLFDALVDAMYAALEKAGGGNVRIVVSESGWPSAGGEFASFENAKTYYTNLINHVNKGTPRRSGQGIETFLFAMFDENVKTGNDDERNFGLFSSNKASKYGIRFA